MKKLHYVFLLMILSLVSTRSFAQMPIDKGTTFVNAGIGVGGSAGVGGIALGAGADFGVAPNITVGGQAAYRSFNYGYLGINDKINYLYFAARGSYHFNELLKLNMNQLDLYAGLGLGYESVSYSSSYGSNFNTFASGVYVPVHIGARYMFSDKIGGVAELGSGVAPLFLGVTFKLK
ncbi:hypothetical protein CLV58_102308 [Spirosoma oryzae]|uniref:Outer membrane protein with beta-barrel domain n=1 Tax=Spirosoma oryzae TaxID=1469603 RepID=A0A2T0TIV1_9BACT|nr:hypothetical protein [Spirosoma oryzae]PRY45559.1 hypothetical protein CLV58_102308 [Spirosoma oryzae]